ncbi:MAG: hypothetical protein MJ132_04815 [Clostridia bacterium]|nr:hypothetical protein [Clostridia bacterium]
MVKVLLKKQFMELFKSYFVNQKTGNARKKGRIVSFFVLFALLMVLMVGIFFGLASILGDALVKTPFVWLYYALMSIVAILMGTFGSVFNTFAALYQAKDNEFLLALPIPPKTLLLSRFIPVYALSLLYSGMVWLAACLYAWIFGSPSALSVIFGILLLFIIPVFVTVLTCLLGWVVALISGKLKNKSFITVIISLVFFGAYYMLCFKMTDMLNALVAHQEKVGETLKTWVNFIYQLGHAADGDVLAFIIFTVISFVLFVLCYYILSCTFSRIVTTNQGGKKVVYRAGREKVHSGKSALLRREFKHFCSSATYMLNTAFGVLLMPVVAVIAVIKHKDIKNLLTVLCTAWPVVRDFLPFAVIVTVCSIVSLNTISTPSVSLEGKTLWLIRTLPVHPRQVLEAKRDLHILLNIVPAVILGVVLCVLFELEFTLIILTVLIIYLFTDFTASFGLMIGLLRPNLSWTSETTPIKQSLNPLIVWVVGWIIPLAFGGIFYLLRNQIEIEWFLYLCVFAMAGAARLCNGWLKTKGVKLFEEL